MPWFRVVSALKLPAWRALVSNVKIATAALFFRGERAEYYEYLADLIDTTGGGKTFQSIFQDDASRYSLSTSRGMLSRLWLARFPQSGGDLFSTWSGTLPLEDLLAIQSAQYAGAQALTKTLRQLAGVVRLVDQARGLLWTTAFVGIAGLVVASVSIVSIPLFTVRQLKKVFAAVPSDYFLVWTKALFSTSEILGEIWPLLLAIFIISVWALAWSFSNWTGGLRKFADTVGPWAFYRRVQTIRFVALLIVTLSPGGSQSARLRNAIALQIQGATPWFASHLYLMVKRLELGGDAADALDTGLIDPEIWWYFTDLARTLGLDEALVRTRFRTEVHALRKIKTQAQYLRWFSLLLALSIVLVIAFWHVQVFEELRQALGMHYSR